MKNKKFYWIGSSVAAVNAFEQFAKAQNGSLLAPDNLFVSPVHLFSHLMSIPICSADGILIEKGVLDLFELEIAREALSPTVIIEVSA